MKLNPDNMVALWVNSAVKSVLDELVFPLEKEVSNLGVFLDPVEHLPEM